VQMTRMNDVIIIVFSVAVLGYAWIIYDTHSFIVPKYGNVVNLDAEAAIALSTALFIGGVSMLVVLLKVRLK